MGPNLGSEPHRPIIGPCKWAVRGEIGPPKLGEFKWALGPIKRIIKIKNKSMIIIKKINIKDDNKDAIRYIKMR